VLSQTNKSQKKNKTQNCLHGILHSNKREHTNNTYNTFNEFQQNYAVGVAIKGWHEDSCGMEQLCILMVLVLIAYRKLHI